ncbi:MAG: acetolactate synthase large subunit [Glaciimonas sp.]|nr:acetolactate synthase large subunit [Glaciimonas sp.]
MNGADYLCDSLLANQIEVCFANPGTSEMHFVAALDRKPQMRCVLGLFEGVITGAADGYARMAEKPAVTLLHLGPGLANSLANMHNAKKARTPMINVVGDHASHHSRYEAPLTSDVEGIARPMSHWVKHMGKPAAIGQDVAQAVEQANRAPGNVCTLILPADTAWTELERQGEPVLAKRAVRPLTSADSIKAAAQAIRSGEPALLFLGDLALREDALDIAGRIRQHCHIDILAEGFSRRISRGATRTPIEKLPYPVDLACARLAHVKHLILVGAVAPVAFFAYPNKPSLLAPNDADIITLASAEQDLLQALHRLADELGVPADTPAYRLPEPVDRSIPTNGHLTGKAISQILARYLPENTVLCDESITAGRDFMRFSVQSAPHDYLQLTGGAIGLGLPMATGAAIACPDRKVISLQADGSAMYTVQALWTQARESLNCLTIILANRSYATLHGEMKNVGAITLGNNAKRMLDLDMPYLQWTLLAQGMGVPATKVDSIDTFTKALKYGLQSSGPYLIEALI